jgi:glycosyltransferase involved in cell wall biosynthesis
MRLLQIVEHYHPHVGGGEKLFADLSAALVARGVEVRVVTSDSGGVRGAREDGGAVILHRRWPSLFDHPIALRRDLAEHVRWADVVQTSQYTAAPAAVAVARRLGRPCVFVAHEYLGDRWLMVEGGVRARAFRAFERWVFAKPYDRFVAVSGATARDLAAGGIEPSRISTVNPVFNDFAYWRVGGQPRRDVFLYYGRPGKTKGVFLLLDAIRALDATLPGRWRFEFILADDPPGPGREFARAVERHGLGARVSVGPSLPQDELRRRLAAAYCVIVPSMTEGFGFSAYQAACMGKNIIASTAGSLPEVVSGNCILFESGSATALADAIARATRGEFEQRPDRVARDGAERMLELYRSLL